MLNVLGIRYTNTEIMAKRLEVAQELIKSSPNIKGPAINRLAASDLRLLYGLYDRIFLNGQFAKEYRGQLKFSFSTRLTRTAGKTLCPENIAQIKPEKLIMEIRLGTDFFFKFHEINSERSVAGIATDSALEALQLVFEHELCHVIEFINFKTSNCRQARFKTLAHNLFGHTASTHQLPTQQKIAEQKYGLKIGDTVKFRFEDQCYEGILYRINKRATIMVKDKKGTHIDKQGNRYSKYYVPIHFLE